MSQREPRGGNDVKRPASRFDVSVFLQVGTFPHLERVINNLFVLTIFSFIANFTLLTVCDARNHVGHDQARPIKQSPFKNAFQKQARLAG